MCNTIYGKKLGMTQVFAGDATLQPVTVLEVKPNAIVSTLTLDKNGYNAIQLGYGEIKESRVNQPAAGHFVKSTKGKVKPTRYLNEVRVTDSANYTVGDTITLEIFAETSSVDVTSTSKGKGFAGVMKRHGFGGGPGGHGSHFHRAPGSVGQCATPSRVYKGLRLPGHMGVDTITTKNLKIVKLDPERNLLLVKGAVPGGKGAFVKIRISHKSAVVPNQIANSGPEQVENQVNEQVEEIKVDQAVEQVKEQTAEQVVESTSEQVDTAKQTETPKDSKDTKEVEETKLDNTNPDDVKDSQDAKETKDNKQSDETKSDEKKSVETKTEDTEK